MLSLDQILNAVKEAGALRAPKQPRRIPPAEPDDHPADVTTILAATDKLLAINRGEAEPDERDSLAFRKIYTPEALIQDRISLDNGHLKKTALRRLSRQRNLEMLPPSFFTPYTEGILFGNPLASPGENLNPMAMAEQSRRISQFGQGGLPGLESITPEANAVHPSIFGFLDPIAGPESSAAGLDTRAAQGTKVGADGKIYQQLRNTKSGKLEWISPDQLHGKVLALPD